MTKFLFLYTLFYRVILKGELKIENNQTTRTMAMEDLHLIRQVLDQTATSFQTLAPVFWRMGLVWLLYGVLAFFVNTSDFIGYYFPPLALPLSLYGLLTWAKVALVVYLLVQCVLWQRRKGGFAALSGQLLGIWQLFLVLYLLLFGVVEAGLRFVPNLGMEMGVFDIMTVCMAFQWFLPVIFPGMPLIITGILLRERGLWWLGVGMAVLGGLLSLGGILMTGYPQPASRQVLLSIGALGLLQYFFQPAALLSGPKKFRTLQDLTGATAGNLGKQLEQLEEEGYLDSKKEFVGRRPNTTYRLLPYGREQFTQYVALLESLLAQAEEEKPEA